MVYLFDDLEAFEDSYVNELLCKLPIDRYEKAIKYRRVLDGKLCILSYMLLCYGLSNEYITQSNNLQLEYNKYGKPKLRDYNIYHNISHCDCGVICAISKYEVGVDIQNFFPYNERLAKRICSDMEFQVIDRSRNKQELLCNLSLFG